MPVTIEGDGGCDVVWAHPAIGKDLHAVNQLHVGEALVA